MEMKKSIKSSSSFHRGRMLHLMMLKWRFYCRSNERNQRNNGEMKVGSTTLVMMVLILFNWLEGWQLLEGNYTMGILCRYNELWLATIYLSSLPRGD
jgi:hypothetical protein